MTDYIALTCTEIRERDSRDGSENPSLPLENFREADAFILLGAPGAGKTEAFKWEAECTGGRYVTARDFVTFDDRPDWQDTALYIDGLDEIRAGSADGRTPLDSIRAKLDLLGCPRFRLSCREADWFGANDRDHLKSVSPDGKVTVLRLDPLSDDGIREFLHRSSIEDADGFIASARERGIDGLLANPLSLKMLAATVAGDGVWPDTRMQTFDVACQTLLSEHNQEHRIAKPDGFDISSLMDAAGRLCAVQLLTGNAGYTLPGNQSDRDFPELERIPGEAPQILRHALGTKLFEAPSEGRTTPVHRQVAEFLAGRYLAGLVEDGLPVGRVLALMTGHDGAVVSELRGLSAWLAAYSKPSRAEVIARDPLGTVLYGDVREFSTDEKRRVLDCLALEAKKNPWFVRAILRVIHIDSRLGDLVSPEMETVVKEILSDPARDNARQSFVFIVIESLRHGQALPGLSELMMKVLRDDTWWPRIRYSVVEAFVRHQRNSEKAFLELELLTADVYAGRVPDPDDDLLGYLLAELYPKRLSVPELLQYLRAPKSPSYHGSYVFFWTSRTPKNSTSAQLVELLDLLVEQFEQLRPVFVSSPRQIALLRRVPIRLLRYLLETSQGNIPLNRLFDWLGVASDPELQSSGEDVKFLRVWLSSKPGVMKEIIKLGVRHCTDSENFHSCMYMVERRLFGATPPSDFGSWCLDQAIAAEDRNEATWFMRKVAHSVRHRCQDENLSRKVVERRLTGNAALEKVLVDRLAALREPDEREESLQEVDETQDQERQRQWLDRVKAHEAALRENRAPPALLHQLAEVYYDQFIDVQGETPGERLRNLLGDDEKLIQAILEGFRGAIRRSDAPTGAEIMRLGTRNRTHHLALPIMAGLEEVVRTSPPGDIFFDKMQMRLVLAIHYTVPIMPQDAVGRPPIWFPTLLASHPDVVSDVLVQSIRSKMRSGKEFRADLYDLAHSQHHATVASLTSLPLLKAFPVRCTERQLPSLSILLHAALLHCKKKSLLELINRKLAHQSMNVAQRVYWLAAGLLVSPEPYLEKLESYVAGNERRVRRLVEVVAKKDDIPQSLIERLDIPALQLLIRLFGSSFRPYTLDSDSETGGIVTPAMEASDRIREFIDKLASNPSSVATEAFETLLADGSLRPWHSLLVDAIYRQSAVRREAEFRYRDVERVIQVLGNRKPANAADLAALTSDMLAKISRNVRDGSTSDWRQYWNVDPHNRPQCPKPENACRDALLSDLKLKMDLLGIDVQPEGSYADDKRSDIRVSCGGFNVPMEIKRSCHRALWSAIKAQLIAKYTRDPGTDGYGIYVVFWFGDTERCRPTPGAGPPPKSAVEIEKRLRGALSAYERLKIPICVIDVSEPET